MRCLIVSSLWFLILADPHISETLDIADPSLPHSVRSRGSGNGGERGPIVRAKGPFPEGGVTPRSDAKAHFKLARDAARARRLSDRQTAEDRHNPSNFAHIKHLKEAAHNGGKHSFSAQQLSHFQSSDLPNARAPPFDPFISEASDNELVHVGVASNQFTNAADSSLFDSWGLRNQFSSSVGNEFPGGSVSDSQFLTNQYVIDSASDQSSNYQQHDALQEPSQLVPENVSRIPLESPFEAPPGPGSSYLPPPPEAAPFQGPEYSFPPNFPPPRTPVGNGSNPFGGPAHSSENYLPPVPSAVAKPFLSPVEYSHPAPLSPKPGPPQRAPLYLPPKQEDYSYSYPVPQAPKPAPGASYLPPPPGPGYAYLPPALPESRPLPPSLPLLPPTPSPADDEGDEREAQYYYYGIGRHLWYVPLYFSIYFIIYVGYLILRSIARHKVTLPAMLHEAAASRRFDCDDFFGQILREFVVQQSIMHLNKK